jgi:hypothetical protein
VSRSVILWGCDLIIRPGIEIDDEAQTLIGQGKEIKDSRPRKEDIVQE